MSFFRQRLNVPHGIVHGDRRNAGISAGLLRFYSIGSLPISEIFLRVPSEYPSLSRRTSTRAVQGMNFNLTMKVLG
jgi:hypothetical protein